MGVALAFFPAPDVVGADVDLFLKLALGERSAEEPQNLCRRGVKQAQQVFGPHLVDLSRLYTGSIHGEYTVYIQGFPPPVKQVPFPKRV